MNSHNLLFAGEEEPAAAGVEIFVFTKNIPQNTPLFSFSMTAISTVYNTSFNITTDYNNSTYTPSAHNQSSSDFSGWDHIATTSHVGAPQIGYGLYKFYINSLDFYFYIDYRDTRYPFSIPCTGQCVDIWIWYDGSTQKFYISSYGDQSPFAEINKGDYLTIWDLQGKGLPSTSGFQNYWSNCLSVVPKFNSSNYLVPFLVWGPIPNFSTTGYKIYRRIAPIEYQYSLIAQVGSSQYTYSDNTLSVPGLNKTAYYKVKAYNGESESEYTNEVNISVNWSAQKRGGDTLLPSFASNQSFIVDQNYPNPFNPSTEIRFSIATPEFVNISVTNVLGQELSVLLNEYTFQGNHTVIFNAAGLPSGIYYYVVRVGKYYDIKKMVYVR